MKKWSLFLLIAISILANSTSGEATQWETVGTGAGKTFYIDTDSISGGPNGPKDAWLKAVNDKPDCTVAGGITNKCVASVVTLERYFNNNSNCVILGEVVFVDGNSFRPTPFPPCKPLRISSGTIGEAVWNYFYQ